MAKKIKVKLTGAVSNFTVGAKTYHSGDEFKIDEKQFVPYLMEKVEKKKVPQKDEAQITVETTGEPPKTEGQEVSTKVEEPPKRKPRKRRKRQVV